MGNTSNLRQKLCHLLVAGCVMGLSCIDEIQLDSPPGAERQVVIQGQLLVKDTSIIRVTVAHTASFQAQSVPQPITMAEVIAEDHLGQQMQLVEVLPGVYELSGDQICLELTAGSNYRLLVRLSEGSLYESTLEPLHAVPAADSISIKLIQREVLNELDQRELKNFMQFFIHTPLQGSGEIQLSRLMWEFEGIYRLDENPPPADLPGPGPTTCFITRNLNLDEVLVYDANKFNNTRLASYFLLEEEVDVRFSQGFLLNVQQQSLSAGAYDYWDKVSKTVGLSGGLFEATPGKIRGNLSNPSDPQEEVLGYFYVSQEYIARRYVHPDEA